jgi:predicted Zn-dependent protease
MRHLGFALLLAAAGCETVDKGLETVGAKDAFKSETGVDADRAATAAKKLSKSFEDMTPEQEYYLGRAVAAEILAGTPAVGDAATVAYVNRVGQVVAQASARPDVYGGYHFFVLDADEPNALAAPGAFIFVNKGLVRACASEDELAGVLAHEVAHVARRHGLRMIQKSERTDALLELGVAEALESSDTAVVAKALGDLATAFTGALVKHGYSREFEKEADLDAVALLSDVGYRPQALPDLLGRLDGAGASGGSLFSDHESLGRRRSDLTAAVAGRRDPAVTEARKRRFAAAHEALK